jgi:hypothetical protein
MPATARDVRRIQVEGDDAAALRSARGKPQAGFASGHCPLNCTCADNGTPLRAIGAAELSDSPQVSVMPPVPAFDCTASSVPRWSFGRVVPRTVRIVAVVALSPEWARRAANTPALPRPVAARHLI